jgi:ribonuclease P protein component
MAAPDRSFPKTEKLCSHKVIDELFNTGRSFVKYPFRVVLLITSEQEVPVRVLVSVSKRRFKRAYKRNLLKRRIREAYRLNKNLIIPLLERNNVNIAIAFVYLPTEIWDFKNIEKAMQDLLTGLKKRLSLTEEQQNE